MTLSKCAKFMLCSYSINIAHQYQTTLLLRMCRNEKKEKKFGKTCMKCETNVWIGTLNLQIFCEIFFTPNWTKIHVVHHQNVLWKFKKNVLWRTLNELRSDYHRNSFKKRAVLTKMELTTLLHGQQPKDHWAIPSLGTRRFKFNK